MKHSGCFISRRCFPFHSISTYRQALIKVSGAVIQPEFVKLAVPSESFEESEKMREFA
jgi:hypothetical protein